MALHKSIERQVGEYIALHYTRAAEIGTGPNFTAAEVLQQAGRLHVTTDLRPQVPPTGIPFVRDDVCLPCLELYTGADVIYAIRPGSEMIPQILYVARSVGADAIVYHLGFEAWGDGGEILHTGDILLHRYYQAENSSKRVF